MVLPLPCLRVLGILRCGAVFGTAGLDLGGRAALAVVPVGDDQLDWVGDHHIAVGALVQVLTQAPLQERKVDEVVPLGHSHLLGEVADALGSIAPAADTADGRHAGVVPAADKAVAHQLQELALAHDGIGEVQAGKFILMRGEDAQLLDEPVVERTVYIEL